MADQIFQRNGLYVASVAGRGRAQVEFYAEAMTRLDLDEVPELIAALEKVAIVNVDDLVKLLFDAAVESARSGNVVDVACSSMAALIAFLEQVDLEVVVEQVVPHGEGTLMIYGILSKARTGEDETLQFRIVLVPRMET